MRTRGLVAVTLLTVLTGAWPASAEARRGGTLAANPVSIGVHIGVVTFDDHAAFALETPFEYTFQAGPGELAIHFGFMLAMEDDFFGILLPFGIRYKIRLLSRHPLYIWPMIDLGPAFADIHGRRDDDWHAFGYLRMGGGLSYLVHPNVELIFQPLGLGAIFGDFGRDEGADFSYNFLVGANFRF